MAGEWLTATANTNMFTYEIAPVFILMEHAVLKKMREIIGYESGDSILAPGGSISNMYALMIARHKMFPQHKAHGMRAIKGQLIMYTSKHVSSKNTTINSHFFGSINVIIGLYLRISFKIEKKTSIVSPTAVKEKKSFLKNSTYATRLRSSLFFMESVFNTLRGDHNF